MDVFWLVLWSAAGVFAVGYLSFLLYQLFYKLRNLMNEAAALQKASNEARYKAEKEANQFLPAASTDPNTLFELLGQRRKRKRQVERKKRDRQRRLIARISKIEINERFR